MFEQIEYNRSLDSDEEIALREIQDQCEHFVNEMVSVVRNRAKRVMNWGPFAFLWS